MATNICKTMIPSTPVGMLSGGMKTMRSIDGKHQHLALILTQLREFLRNEYKPSNLSELKQGIKAFWESPTPEIRSRYIRHLKKVIPKVLEVNVGPFGYCVLFNLVLNVCTCTLSTLL